MPIRTSTDANYERVLSGLRFNLARLVRSQEQVATGRRILRPSDDPSGASRVLSFNRQLASTDRFLGAINLGRSVVDTGAVALENGSGIIAEVRENLLQGMNGSLAPDDREALANEVELLRLALLEVANTRAGDRSVFGGTTSGQSPWKDVVIGGRTRAVYAGNDEEQTVAIGEGVSVGITVSGLEPFGKDQGSGTVYSGLTGVAKGATADEGAGYEYLTLRHDATNAGAIGTVGLALANGGADDTFLGSAALVIDPAAGTVQFGGGPVRDIPDPLDPDFADFVIENPAGGELHLDFSAYSGGAFNGAVTASGSISIDGATFQNINFLENDFNLVHPDSGNTIHVDLTNVTRTGVEVAAFEGKVNVFDTLQGIADDLRNGDGLEQTEIVDRLNIWIGELDRNQGNLLVSLGSLGSRGERMNTTEEKLQNVQLQLESLRSQELDADISEAALELAEAQQGLELAQASGVRLLQTSLLNFLR